MHVFGLWKEPECPEEDHAGTRRTCKQTDQLAGSNLPLCHGSAQQYICSVLLDFIPFHVCQCASEWIVFYVKTVPQLSEIVSPNRKKKNDPNPGELCVGTTLPLEGDNCCLLILILCLCGPQDLPSLKKYNGDGRLNSRAITSTPVKVVYCWRSQHISREPDNYMFWYKWSLW